MNKEQIKANIIAIIDDANGYIIADEIYNLLRRQVDPGRT